MNLLHLAAALGLLRVLCTLLNWRLENSSPALEREMSPLANDQQGYTPLMWACAQGHRDVVALLAQWDPSALNVHDRSGKSAWDVARQRGHHSLAEELETRRILSVRRSTAEPPPPISLNKPSSSKPAAGESVAARQMLMAKRSSVDSVPNNNNNNNEPVTNSHPGYWRRPNAAKAHKLSRWNPARLKMCSSLKLASFPRDDRSYSLPLGGAGQAYSSGRNSTGSNISSLAHDPSPSPHMDSSACKYGPASGRRHSIFLHLKSFFILFIYIPPFFYRYQHVIRARLCREPEFFWYSFLSPLSVSLYIHTYIYIYIWIVDVDFCESPGSFLLKFILNSLQASCLCCLWFDSTTLPPRLFHSFFHRSPSFWNYSIHQPPQF